MAAPSMADAVTRSLIIVFIICCVLSSSVFGFNHVHYSKEELLSFRNINSNCDSVELNNRYPLSFFKSVRSDFENNNNGVNKNKRKRGKRSGALVRSRNKFKKTPLPNIFLSNVNRLYNKTDELFQRLGLNEYKYCQALCLTEIWLKECHPDSLISPPGFTPFRCDRDCDITNKSCGGGVMFLINQEWCKNIKVLS